uniref:Uncharacterized protein n=1 Tax=Arundo donax TaxID=35708 RepID=A0A0A9H2F4_ARUDO
MKIARCSLRNASIWKRANALVYVSTRANCQLRLSLKITWVLIYIWSQILKIIAASSTSECHLLPSTLTKPSRNLAWTFARMRGDARSLGKIVAQMSSVVPKFDMLLSKVSVYNLDDTIQ